MIIEFVNNIYNDEKYDIDRDVFINYIREWYPELRQHTIKVKRQIQFNCNLDVVVFMIQVKNFGVIKVDISIFGY